MSLKILNLIDIVRFKDVENSVENKSWDITLMEHVKLPNLHSQTDDDMN